MHYKKLSAIVEETALEFGLPYHSMPSFRKAIAEHTKMLKRLGNEDWETPNLIVA